MTVKNESYNVNSVPRSLIYSKYENVRYCLLCEKVQIVWSHFKSVQDEYVHVFFFFWYIGTFANNLVKLVDIAALTSKLESYHPLHFITKGSYTVAFSTQDVRRPPKVMSLYTIVHLLLSAHCFLRINPT